jgi:lysophospholipase L1-like esterase
MAFGLQFDRLFEMLDAGTYTPDAFDTGYTDVLATRMRQLRRDQQTANLSCPGESTDTMIKGGCEYTVPEPDGPGLALHTDYEGAQLDAAVSFLRAHRRQVSPITVSIGGIDAGTTIADTCNFDVTCVERSGLRDRLARGLDRILRMLNAAAPDAEIVLVVFYNPFSVSNPGTDRLWQRNYTAVEKDVARRNDVRVADVAEIVNAGNVCQLTFLCASGDSHPTDVGYRRIADQIFRVAGYQRISRDDR